jgi:hypothetical protein
MVQKNRTSILASLTLLWCCTVWAQAPKRRPKPTDTTASCDPLADRAAFTLKEVIFMLQRPNLQGCVVKYVTEKGVSFHSTQENLDLLDLFNPSPELIKLIPPPPPPPKPVVGGPLTIQCEASEGHECEIIVNDRYYGRTEKGQKLIPDLKPGEAKVRVWSEGLEPMEKTVSLNAATPQSLPFSLQRSLLARRESARDLLSQTVQKRFGGTQGLAEMAELASTEQGTATVSDGGSGRQEWYLQVTQQRWGAVTARYTNKASNKDCTVIKVPEKGAVSSEDCSGKGKAKTGPPQLIQATVLFVQCQVHARLAQLLTRRVIDMPDSEKTAIGTDDGPDSYVLSLESAGRPTSILYRPEAADAKPIKAEYADYSEEKGHAFPRKMIVWEGDMEKPVAEFALTSIGSAGPSLGKKKPAK